MLKIPVVIFTLILNMWRLLIFISAYGLGEKGFCGNGYIPKRTNRRQLQSTVSFDRDPSWGRLRFAVDWSNVSPATKAQFGPPMEAAFTYYSNALQVHQLINSIDYTSDLDAVAFPDGVSNKDFLGKSLSADILVQMRAENNSTEEFVAWCEYWAQDPNTKQPVTAVIMMNLAYMSEETETQMVQTLTHELTHGLGFDGELFPLFTNSNGTQYGYDILVNVTKRGKTVTMVGSENVKARSRASFGCDTLEGLELQDTGGDGTAFSHWAARVMYNELMNPQELLLEPVYSDLTLALLEDSGWYLPDYSYGQTIQWGYQRGCNFFNDDCIINQTAAFPEFCADQTGDNICDFNLFGYGPCYFTQDSGIPSYEQYFSDKSLGGDPLADYCPVVYDLVDCGGGIGAAQNSDAGEMFCRQCRCIEGTFSLSGTSNVNRPSCHQISCGNNTATITIGSYQAVCSTSGEIVNVTGLAGTVTCPDIVMICDFKACTDNCLGEECINGVCSYSSYSDAYFLLLSSLLSSILLI